MIAGYLKIVFLGNQKSNIEMGSRQREDFFFVQFLQIFVLFEEFSKFHRAHGLKVLYYFEKSLKSILSQLFHSWIFLGTWGKPEYQEIPDLFTTKW